MKVAMQGQLHSSLVPQWPLALSLPECLMDFSKEKLTLILWTKSYDVTIQLKPLCINLHMVLFVFQNFKILSKFAFG